MLISIDQYKQTELFCAFSCKVH